MLHTDLCGNVCKHLLIRDKVELYGWQQLPYFFKKTLFIRKISGPNLDQYLQLHVIFFCIQFSIFMKVISFPIHYKQTVSSEECIK